MTCTVWMTDAMTDTALNRGFVAPDSYYEDLSAANRTVHRQRTGALVEKSAFPPSKLVLKRRLGSLKPMPHFINSDVSFISKELKELLCQFELGQTVFHPVALYGLDGKEVLGPEYFYINVAERKNAFDPTLSNVEKQRFTDGYMVSLLSEKSDVVVKSTACEGVDLWMEANLYGTMFLSDQLMQAIDDSKYLRKVRFRKCEVI